MSLGATSEKPWAPPPDEELSWFRAEQKLFAAPRPLDYTLEIHALVFGLTYALESNEFPLYALRSRLLHGRVYLAAVPSAMAERDVAQRLKNIHDQSIRFTKNIQRAWDRQIKPAVEKHNRWFEEAATFAGSPSELAGQVRKLRRERGNQWFTMLRGIVAPAALLQANVGEFGPEVAGLAANLTRQGLEGVADRGRALVAIALGRVGERLVEANVIEKADDVFWLEWQEVRDLLQIGQDRRALLAARKAEAARLSQLAAPETIGPELPPDAPRMYLIHEILKLLDL